MWQSEILHARSGTFAARRDETRTVVDEDQDTLLTRRRLLATGAVAVAAITLPEASASASTQTAAAAKEKLARSSRKGYRRSRFDPHVGAPVKLRPRGGTGNNDEQ